MFDSVIADPDLSETPQLRQLRICPDRKSPGQNKQRQKMMCSCCNQYVEKEDTVWIEHEKTGICLKCHNAFLDFMESFSSIYEQMKSSSDQEL